MQYVITQTKTGCGVRDLPMTQGVYECFQCILKARRRPKVEPIFVPGQEWNAESGRALAEVF